MKLKWQSQKWYIETAKIGAVINRYLKRYANFEKYLNSIPAKEVIENGDLKLIRYSKTKAFILLNYKRKVAGFCKKIPRGIADYNDKHYIEFLASLYNDKEWNIIYDNEYSITQFNNIYETAVLLVKTGKPDKYRSITDNVMYSPEKLKMRAKVKNLNAWENKIYAFLFVKSYPIPYNYNKRENLYKVGSKVIVVYSKNSGMIERPRTNSRYIYIGKIHEVIISY